MSRTKNIPPKGYYLLPLGSTMRRDLEDMVWLGHWELVNGLDGYGANAVRPAARLIKHIRDTKRRAKVRAAMTALSRKRKRELAEKKIAKLMENNHEEWN